MQGGGCQVSCLRLEDLWALWVLVFDSDVGLSSQGSTHSMYVVPGSL